jgi:HTH-type transcriptional regulator / antitoxin HigA
MQINTQDEYNLIMNKIHVLMSKGEENLSDNELIELREMAEAAEQWEDVNFPEDYETSKTEI